MSTLDVFGWVATGLSAVVFCGPAAEFFNVFKGRLSYEDTSTFLIGTTYCNCLAWYVYGNLIASKQVKFCNLGGCCISLLFTVIYLAYEIKKYLTDTILNALIVFTGSWAAYRALTIILANPPNVGKVCIGTAGIALICQLNLVYRVIREKNYKLVSVTVAVFTILSGLCWDIYGFMEKNYYIVCANSLYVLVAIIQIVVSRIYKKKYPTIEQIREISTIGIESTGEDESSKKQASASVKIGEESEGEIIKAKPVKITGKPESQETPV